MQQRWNKIEAAFYLQENVIVVAKALLGKILVSNVNNVLTAGRIVETEAYNGMVDKASHSYGGRRTNRTEIMYAEGGISYVYLCYGIHHLFNVVCNVANTPHAVLIRALEPLMGIEDMLLRTNKKTLDNTLTKGPGNVCKALGINTTHTGSSLLQDLIYIVDNGFKYADSDIMATPRIGVDYAGADAHLPYRFIVKDNKNVSGKR
jgi:DNA-3-methyladenine glycosylase